MIVLVALIDHFILQLAHMAGTYLNEGYRRAFVKGKLLVGLLGGTFLDHGRLSFVSLLLFNCLHDYIYYK
jgi:hypothetical protein